MNHNGGVAFRVHVVLEFSLFLLVAFLCFKTKKVTKLKGY